jgi:hypothetical protein
VAGNDDFLAGEHLVNQTGQVGFGFGDAVDGHPVSPGNLTITMVAFERKANRWPMLRRNGR